MQILNITNKHFPLSSGPKCSALVQAHVCILFSFPFCVSGEVRVPGLQNGGPGWEGGGEGPAPAYQPQGALPGPQGAPQPPPPGQAQGEGAGGGGQMNKKPTRRPGIKPPPDRAKRSIYLFSLKNPIRQLFIKVNSNIKLILDT